MTREIVTTADLETGLNLLWSGGMRKGDSTGWASVDEHFTVVPGQLTLVTGWPGSGKSEWVDAMMCNLARGAWRFAIYSPENYPIQLHMSKLIEKWTGKPFGDGPTKRLQWDEVRAASEDLAERFGFMKIEEDALTGEEILDRAGQWFARQDSHSKLGLVIDPWNEVSHIRDGESETDYVSAALGGLRRWARSNAVHVFVVAHPAKQRREDGKLPVPKPDMIAGSQHWWNKADNCITVWRDYDQQTPDVDICVQKVRFKHIGRIGRVTLQYDRVTGRYMDSNRDSSGRVIEYSFGGR